MEHHFELPVEYKGEELNLIGRLSVYGYVYKFNIIINDVEFVFEKDDDGKYRVLRDESTPGPGNAVDRGLVQAVVKVLDGLSEA